MSCSALKLDYRRESTAMPVPLVRPLLEASEYSRPKYTGSSSSYTRRTPLASSKPSYTSDTLRYTSPRSGLGLRSTSLTYDYRDRSQTRDVTRSSRDSSRSRLSSCSSTDTVSKSSSTVSTLRKSAFYTPFDLNEFRTTYLSSSYISSSGRTSKSQASSAVVDTSPTTSSIVTSSSSSSRVKTSPSVVREKRAPASASTATEQDAVEVNRDENDNVTKLSGGDMSTDTDTLEVKLTTVDDGKDSSSSVGSESSEMENYSSRITPRSTTSYGVRRDASNDNNGLSGLRNIGNTCFLNSVVQCLSNTRMLKDYLLSKEYINEITNTESRGMLMKSFADVICELWSGEGKVVNTTSFKAQIQKYAPRFMGYNQQDAQEFLRYLLQGLHDDINRVTVKPRNLPQRDDNLSDSVKASESWKQYLRFDNSWIVDLFVGQLKSTLQCTSCGHCSTTFEVFWDLSLPLPSRSGSHRLYQCLDHFTKEEVLDGDEMPTCSQCKTRRKCTKRFSIQKFPKILVLHLKRFSPSERYRKLSATVDFPLTNLDMSPYSSTPQASSYNLYAVSNHSGTAYSGHYTAYCLHPHSGQWHEYNDSRVCSVSSRNVVSSEAYILFYEQITGVTTSRL